MGRKLSSKAPPLIAAGSGIQLRFRILRKNTMCSRTPCAATTHQNIETAIEGISRTYFRFSGTQAKFAQLLNDFDIRGVGYAKSVLDFTLDMAMACRHCVWRRGHRVAYPRGIAIAVEELMAKGARASVKRAYEAQCSSWPLALARNTIRSTSSQKPMAAHKQRRPAGALGRSFLRCSMTRRKHRAATGESLRSLRLLWTLRWLSFGASSRPIRPLARTLGK